MNEIILLLAPYNFIFNKLIICYYYFCVNKKRDGRCQSTYIIIDNSLIIVFYKKCLCYTNSEFKFH